MKPIEVYAWQFNGKFDGTASSSFSEWTENFAPDRFKSWDDWTHKAFVIEVFMPTRNSTECYYLEKNDWFVFYPRNNAFTVISNDAFELLYEKADECIE